MCTRKNRVNTAVEFQVTKNCHKIHQKVISSHESLVIKVIKVVKSHQSSKSPKTPQSYLFLSVKRNGQRSENWTFLACRSRAQSSTTRQQGLIHCEMQRTAFGYQLANILPKVWHYLVTYYYLHIHKFIHAVIPCFSIVCLALESTLFCLYFP